jgi:hypothetical protein
MDIRNIKIISLVLVCLVSINFVLALGVSSPYWEENPLKIAPGETRQVEFILVNRPTGETQTAVVTLINDGGIAEVISGTEYTIKPGEGENVMFRITAPENAKIGNSYDVEFEVQSSSSEEGQVPVSLGYNVKFPVQIVKQSDISPAITVKGTSEGLAIGWIILTLIVVVSILTYLILKEIKKKK